MPPLETIGTFCVAALLLAFVPGPDNCYVLTQSAIHGKRAGLMVTAGLCSGLLVHSAAVAFGVAALITASNLAFTSLKICGACYLLYLAWRLLREKDRPDDQEATPPQAAWRLYLRGIIMNISNPKVAVFFLAFLPQFADPSRGSMALQLLLLGGTFIIATMLVFGSIAFAAGSIGPYIFDSTLGRRILRFGSAGIFAGLALKLAISER